MNEMVGRIRTVPTPESITVIFRFFFPLFLRFSSGFEPPTWKKKINTLMKELLIDINHQIIKGGFSCLGCILIFLFRIVIRGEMLLLVRLDVSVLGRPLCCRLGRRRLEEPSDVLFPETLFA